MCDRGEVVFDVEGGRSCCEPLGLSFGHHDGLHRSQSDVRIEGINVFTLIMCNVYEVI